MSSVHVDEASGIAKWLTRREASGPGDMENAWRRLEARYGLPWRMFWALRYRPPRIIDSVLFERLRAAYNAERDRQMQKLRNEIKITEEIAGADHRVVIAVRALAGETDET
jgi:hypothetical protein